MQVQRLELRVTVGNRIEDLRKVLVASNEYSVQKLREIADEIEAWLQKVWLLCVSCHQTTPTSILKLQPFKFVFCYKTVPISLAITSPW